MKLIIQIPCYNEEDTLESVINSIPKSIIGIDEIELLVIDDGSTDNTKLIAEKLGAKVICNKRNMGLAASFKTGLKTALKNGADIIVNTDGDNQYNSEDIPELIKPIIEGSADMVIGARDIKNHKEFSLTKKILQQIGSKIVKLLSGSDIKDAPSGFRAFSRKCAQSINIFDNFSYTMETIIQASAKGYRILSVPIRVNKTTRKSRLFKNTLQYVIRSACTIIRMFAIYRPFRFFTIFAALFLVCGFTLFARYLYYFINNDGSGHIQSLLLATVLTIIGVLIQVIAIFADLISINRKLLEDIQLKINKN